MITRPSRKLSPLNESGFTLIEVLVVLIIVGMLGSILFQALERAYRLQGRFGVELFNAQQGQMATDWYRQTVQGLYPDYPEGKDKFQGDARKFSGLTSNPLNSEYGALAAIAWEIRNDSGGRMQLIYEEGKRETAILSWQGDARFVYFDAQQKMYGSWPPPMDLAPQLPGQIRLLAQDGDGPVDIVAVPMGPPTPLPRVQDE